ncbi:response regulator transcription factor [Clostridioides difficile]
MVGLKKRDILNNNQKLVMIMEDDDDLSEGITLSLQNEELNFIICKTIAEARESLKNNVFDLLIFDINLPDGNGLQFCCEIRNMIKVPIVLLTAKDMELDIVKGLESGADDYITKPFSLMVLRARIRALLRRNVAESEKKYKDSTFLFKFESMEFYKKGISIELSKTEQRILYLLSSNPNKILTREHLLEWVWPDGTEYVEDNALSVGIRRLRDKLEDDSSNPVFIKTIYGKGYVWESL